MRNLFHGQRGEGTVSVLMAAGIIGVALVGSLALLKFARTGSQFSRIVGSALATETSILTALQSKATYTDSMAIDMRSNVVPSNFEVTSLVDGSNQVVAKLNQKLLFDEEGKSCTIRCAYSTQLAMKCDPPVSGSGPGICRVAYRMEIDPKALTVSVPALGASVWPPKDEDFTQVIDFDLFRKDDTSTICDSSELFVTGMDKGTGAVTCVRPSLTRVPEDSIPRTIQYNAGSKSMEFKTARLKTGVCLPKYVAQSFNPSSLDESSGGVSGTCVFRYKKQVPWMKPWPADAPDVTGRFCPNQDYKAEGTGRCSVTIKATDGWCRATCHDKDGKPYDCSYSRPADTRHKLTYNVSGPNASCSATPTGTQACGSSVEFAVNWSGVCKIIVPETMPMGGG